MRNSLHSLSQRLPTAASVALISAMALASQACTEDSVCTDSAGVRVCGSFGTQAYKLDLSQNPIEWPPVAVQNGDLIVARGQELLRIGKVGTLTSIGSVGANLTVPSSDEAGNLYLMSGSGAQASVQALNGSDSGNARWSQQLSGTPTGTPPSMSADTVYASTSNFGSNAKLYALDRQTGAIRYTRSDSSPAAVLPDGSIRYLSGNKGIDSIFGGSLGGQPRFASLVAEDGNGKVQWTYKFPNGVVDFAPGPKGETYAVTGGDHVLQRVSSAGQIDWTFKPDCNDCTVAAAPTVTRDVVYFPVWEKRVEPIDPLYAIDAVTGQKRWVFDGFSTKSTAFSPAKYLAPGSAGAQPIDTFSTQHHPAGRPVVAQDGTLYVSTDGAVTSLDSNGQVSGIALYDAAAGEVSLNTGFMAQPTTWITPGVRPSPVLGPDGTLYVWDGANLRAFRAGKPATSGAWVAPFGSTRNDGRLPQ